MTSESQQRRHIRVLKGTAFYSRPNARLESEKKNWLFAGSDKGGERIANVLTLIETAKMHGHNPQACFTHILTVIRNYPDA